MEERKIKKPYQAWGLKRIQTHIDLTPGAKIVAHERARRLTKLQDFKVSLSNIFETALIQQLSGEERRRVEKLNKEWIDGKKYMDIKRDR